MGLNSNYESTYQRDFSVGSKTLGGRARSMSASKVMTKPSGGYSLPMAGRPTTRAGVRNTRGEDRKWTESGLVQLLRLEFNRSTLHHEKLQTGCPLRYVYTVGSRNRKSVVLHLSLKEIVVCSLVVNFPRIESNAGPQ